MEKTKRLPAAIGILKENYKSRKMIFKLAKNDFKTKYAGSYLGIIWAFVQPIMTILLYWFVFQVGFRSQPYGDYPFVLWLTAGLVPWFFFSDAWNGATNSMLEYSFLVKKVVFDIGILPVIKIFSAFFVNIFFSLFMVVLFMVNGYMPTNAYIAAYILSYMYNCIMWCNVILYIINNSFYKRSRTSARNSIAGAYVDDTYYVEYTDGTGKISVACKSA